MQVLRPLHLGDQLRRDLETAARADPASNRRQGLILELVDREPLHSQEQLRRRLQRRRRAEDRGERRLQVVRDGVDERLAQRLALPADARLVDLAAQPPAVILMAVGQEAVLTVLAREDPENFVVDGRYFRAVDENGEPIPGGYANRVGFHTTGYYFRYDDDNTEVTQSKDGAVPTVINGDFESGTRQSVLDRLVGLGAGAYLLPDRFSQPPDRADRLGLVVLDLRSLGPDRRQHGHAGTLLPPGLPRSQPQEPEAEHPPVRRLRPRPPFDRRSGGEQRRPPAEMACAAAQARRGGKVRPPPKPPWS